jgi:nucleoside-diphosphate-sugar epimerase
MRRILILGGDEFIGGNVLLALAKSNWARPVTEPANLERNPHPNIEALAFNATEPASVALALRGIDAVVNCLSGRAKLIADAATALYFSAARSTELPLIVHISSMSAYGSATGQITEDAPLQDNLGPYSSAKVRAERASAPYARKVILRPGCEYGPRCELWSGRIAKWLCARRIGDLGAAGDGICNLVHIDDLVDAVLLSLQRPAAVGQAFNLSVPDPPTWNEYLVRFAKYLGAVPVKRISSRRLALESKVLAVPLKALEIAAQRIGIDPRLPHPIPPSFLALARQEIRLDSTRARRILGWQCKSWDQGVFETAAWFRS